jgi:hypothetical protein
MAMTETVVSEPPEVPKPAVLTEAVADCLDGLDEPRREDDRWRVTTKDEADWAMRKLAKSLRESVEVQASAQRQILAIQESVEPYLEPVRVWESEELTRLSIEANHWTAILNEFHKVVLHEDPEALSVKLPHGTLTSRKAPDSWEFDDEAFLAWAKATAPEFVRVTESPDKALAKKMLKVNDEGAVSLVLPDKAVDVTGITVTTGERNFTPKPSGLS